MSVDNLDRFFETGKKVAVLGAGLSGQAAIRLLNLKGWECRVFDEKEIQFSVDDAAECSFVVKSPGFRPDHPWLHIAKSLKKIIFSEIDLGAIYSEHEYLLAITGTNGKTSLTTILTHLCREIGVPCESVGNIGKPFCDLVADGKTKGKYLFLETSSFQTTNIQKLSPDGVIWTNFSEDHLDYHNDDKKSYFLAKLNLVKSCKNPDNIWVGESVLNAATTFGLKCDLFCNCVSPLCTDTIPSITPSFLRSYPQRKTLH